MFVWEAVLCLYNFYNIYDVKSFKKASILAQLRTPLGHELKKAHSVSKLYFQTPTSDLVVPIMKKEYPGEKQLSKQRFFI